MPLSAERRQQLITRGGQLNRIALRENRPLTTEEQAELVRIEAEIDAAEMVEKHPAERRFASSVELRSTRRELRPGELRTYKPTEKISDDHPQYTGPRMVRKLKFGDGCRCFVGWAPASGD